MLKTPDNPNGVPQETLDQIAAGLESDRAKFFRHTFVPQFFGVGFISSPVSDDVLDLATSTALRAGLWPTLAAAEAFGHTDFRPDLPAFRVPTLIIHGTADNTVPIDASARTAAKGIAQSKLIEYEGEPHGLNVTASQRLTKDLLTFVGAQSSRGEQAAPRIARSGGR